MTQVSDEVRTGAFLGTSFSVKRLRYANKVPTFGRCVVATTAIMETKMHYSYDPRADALYIYLRDDAAISQTIQVDDRRNVDVDEQGQAVGIEVLSPGSSFPIQDLISRFNLSTFQDFLESVATTPLMPLMGTASLDETAGSMPDLQVPSRDEWDRGNG